MCEWALGFEFEFLNLLLVLTYQTSLLNRTFSLFSLYYVLDKNMYIQLPKLQLYSCIKTKLC